MPTIINGSSPSITFSDNTTQSSGISSVAGVIQPAGGGTGQSSYTNGQLLIGNTTGNTLTKATLTAGTGVSVTNGTGSITLANTGVTSVNGLTGAVTVTSNPGTVTSVATGNGLSGGTITSTGTLVVACPDFNTVGSYCTVGDNGSSSGISWSSGSNYSAGGGTNQVISIMIYRDPEGSGIVFQRTNNLSGTWKWMSGTYNQGGLNTFGLACRVS
jgi:hypothetical protein